MFSNMKNARVSTSQEVKDVERNEPHSGIVSTPFVVLDEETVKSAPSMNNSERNERLNGTMHDSQTGSNSQPTLNEDSTRSSQQSLNWPLIMIQLLSFMGGFCLIFSSIISIQEHGIENLSVAYIVIAFYSWIFGLFIVALEGRVVVIEIYSLHRIISKYAPFLELMWCRGLFYIFVGSFHICLMSYFSSITSIYITVVGLLSVCYGSSISSKLNRPHRLNAAILSQQMFDFFDADKDGYIDIESFRDLVIGTGIHTSSCSDDICNEFDKIDEDKDGLISYPQVKEWFDIDDCTSRNALDGIESIWTY